MGLVNRIGDLWERLTLMVGNVLDERVGKCSIREWQRGIIEGATRTEYTEGGLGVLNTVVKKSANDSSSVYHQVVEAPLAVAMIY